MRFLSFPFDRHPELVSGSISPANSVLAARWMLKQVQHDVAGEGSAFTYWRQAQTRGQIRPMWVFAVNQVYLPRSVPVFQLFLARNSGVHIAKHFKADEAIDGVFRREAIRHFEAMLLHALHQVRRYANIKRAVMLARQNIDAGLLFFSHRLSDALKWTLKQVQGDGLFSVSVPQSRHPEFISGSIGKFAQFIRQPHIPLVVYKASV